MQEITIQNLGPIDECTITCSSTMIFTGAQASGKSTIAKAIYFGHAIKDELYNLILSISSEPIVETVADNFSRNFRADFEQRLRQIFFKLFGPIWTIRKNAMLRFIFQNQYAITLEMVGMKRLEVLLSSPFACTVENMVRTVTAPDLDKEHRKQTIVHALGRLFSESRTPIFIPAARSLMTSLGNQFGYLYATMGDKLRDGFDYGTQAFIEKALEIMPEFSSGIGGLEATTSAILSRDKTYEIRYNTLKQLAETILKGSYRQTAGEDRLYIDDKHYVRLNYASSGQQEAVWIINLIAYHLIKNKQVVYIIEEPETHLYPEAQQQIAKLIALARNVGNDVLVTTHSPYVLGAFNNLLYADKLSEQNILDKELSCTIPANLRLDGKNTQAFFVEKGGIANAIEQETGLIDNELIDGASHDINREYDRLANLEGAF